MAKAPPAIPKRNERGIALLGLHVSLAREVFAALSERPIRRRLGGRGWIHSRESRDPGRSTAGPIREPVSCWAVHGRLQILASCRAAFPVHLRRQVKSC